MRAEQFSLNEKVAIITGSSRGIGKAIARGLAENGAHVIISSRSPDTCEDVAAEFSAEGLSATAMSCHVGNANDRKALVNRIIEKYGRLDVLVNNAAINPVYGPLEETDESVFDKIMAINVKAPWQLAKLALPHMKKQSAGSIINVASVEAEKPGFGLGIYSTSKAALVMLTKNMAKEWGAHGVRANVLCPGLVQTKFSKALWQDDATLQKIETQLPAARMGQPHEMTGVACLLASAAGSYITGSVFTADGGYLISG